MTDEEVPQSDLPDTAVSAPNAPTSGAPVPPEDLPDSGNAVPPEDLPDEQNQYASPLQQAGTVAEGLAKGVAGPAATWAEQKLSSMGVPGMTDADIKGRAATNPGEATLGEIGGNVALGAALPEIKLAEEAGMAAKAGFTALKAGIGMGLIRTGDEISDAMLGQGNPLPVAAAHILQSGALGLFTGGLFGAASGVGNKAAQLAEDSKLGTWLKNFTSGVGHEASYAGMEPSEKLAQEQLSKLPEDLHGPSFKMGQDFYNAMLGKASTKGIKHAADLAGAVSGGLPGYALGHVMGMVAEKALNKTIPIASQKVIGPMLIKAASSGTMEGLSDLLNHATSIAAGNRALTGAIQGVFESAPNQALKFETKESDREKLRDFIENGGVDKEIRDQASSQPKPAGFALGGDVQPDSMDQQENPIAKLYPEQNVMLNSAKARVSNYLNASRPMPPNKMPYDSAQKDPSKEREYNKTLDLAIKPISILKHVKDGTLLPKHVQDFTQMYPELHEHMSKKLIEEMTHQELDKKKRPSHKVRQAMSLFLGAPLDSTMTPQGIMAAQATFVQQKAQAAGDAKAKALAETGKNSQTPEQAREQRLTKN